MLFGLLTAGCCEAEDALLHQLSLAGTGAATCAPAAGGIDGNHAGADHAAAPVAELFNIPATQLAGIDAIAEGHGMEALAGAAHINAHHRDRGSGGQGMFLHGSAAAKGVRIHQRALDGARSCPNSKLWRRPLQP
jgi:hypothetical protein